MNLRAVGACRETRMAEAKRCKTVLIEDIPALEDAFSSPNQTGPHQRVAIAIAELIESSERGGKIIGLEGGWGAGKSTVVNLLRKRIESNNNLTIVTFDAWAHEGDPLRRTFLETLILHLQRLKWIETPKWNEKLDEIANRRKSTTTRTVPKPTSLGICLSIALLLVPFGTAFLVGALRDGLFIGRLDQPISWKFVVGLLSLSPLFVIVVHAVRLLSRKPFSLAHLKNLEHWAFLEGKFVNEIWAEAIETPNPTSLEFEKYFGTLMAEALSRHQDRRVVLVLDNLDRVDPKDALEIWSTLQTFVKHHPYTEQSWSTGLWIVVPFDSAGLRKLWDHDFTPSDGTTTSERAAVSDSFFDKSFQIRFFVPPPVLSGWKELLNGLLAKALPEHGEDQHRVFRVFDQFKPNTGDSPTPRELKLFVNQLGAVHRQWQHDFPIDHVAYFVLQCRDQQTFIDELRAGKLPTQEANRMLGKDLVRNLAGLAFNVRPAKGLELLLTDSIYREVSDGTVEALNALAAQHGDAFWWTLENVACTKFFGAHSAILSKTALTLAESKLLESAFRPEADTVRKELRSAAEATSEWTPIDEPMINGIAALCRIEADESFSKMMLEKAVAGLEAASPTESTINPRLLVNSIITLFGTLESLGHEKVIPKNFTLPFEAQRWKVACEELSQRDPERRYWGRIRPHCEPTDVQGALQAAITNGQFIQQDIDTIRVTAASPLKVEWNGLVPVLSQRLDASVGAKSNEVLSLLQALCVLREIGVSEVKAAVKHLVDLGHVMHHFQRATKAENHDCQAICAYVFLKQRPDGKKPQNAAGNSEAGFTNFEAALAADSNELTVPLVALLKRYDDHQLIFGIVDARSKYDRLTSACLREIASGEAPGVVFTAEVVRNRWSDLSTHLNEGEDKSAYAKLIGVLIRDTNLCAAIQQGDFVTKEAGLYLSMLEQSKQYAPDFAEWCREGLGDLTKEEWISDLSGNYSCARLLVGLATRGTTPGLSVGFADAMDEHVRLIARGELIPPDDVRVKWSALLDCFDESTRKGFGERLVRLTTNLDAKLDTAFFVVYGNELGRPDILASNKEVTSRLFENLLRNRGPIAGIAWMKTVFKAAPDILERTGPAHAAEEFRNRLSYCVTNQIQDDAQALITDIADTLGVGSANEKKQDPGVSTKQSQ